MKSSRNLLSGAFVATAVSMLTFTAPLHAEELTVSTAGGAVTETEAAIFAEPFEEETGWTVRYVSAEATRMAEIEAMVQAGKTLWDVSEISASNYPIGVAKGLLEPID